MMKRRTFLAASAGVALAVPLITGGAHYKAEAPDNFAAFKSLSQDQHCDLIAGYVRHIDRYQDGAMWAGRMCQNYISVVPAALLLGASSFNEVSSAFSLPFLLDAKANDNLPGRMRRRIEKSLSVIPSFDEELKTAQPPSFQDHFEFMAGRFRSQLALFEVGYAGSDRDMAAGQFDWGRATVRQTAAG